MRSPKCDWWESVILCEDWKKGKLLVFDSLELLPNDFAIDAINLTQKNKKETSSNCTAAVLQQQQEHHH